MEVSCGPGLPSFIRCISIRHEKNTLKMATEMQREEAAINFTTKEVDMNAMNKVISCITDSTADPSPIRDDY